tara:strand:- start:1472 stop:2944 length:1473 start_codon:yes stop_codon:yes gene_type:complete
MGAVLEIKYFNSFLLKKISKDSGNNEPIYLGSFGIPQAIGGYPATSVSIDSSEWAIEEARIRGGFNNTNVDYGVRAYLVEDEPNSSQLFNTLIYSGIYNSRTGINDTNVFSVGEDITRSVDPSRGSIQKLYAEDTNLIIFQEDKVNRALIDKDAIYTAAGTSSAVSQVGLVIGQIVPYAGEYGISKDPQSFAIHGYRKYFTDRNRNAVLRLSRDGITEISEYGMYDYFRNEFNSVNTNIEGRVIGGWDAHNKQYVVSTQTNNLSFLDKYKTLSFDENVKGWVSFFDFKPDHVFSLKNNMYTLKRDQLWLHYSSAVNRGNFYGVNNKTSITFVFNPNVSLSKNFKTISYEGSNGWEVTSFISDPTGLDDVNTVYVNSNDTTNKVYSYQEGEYIINPANNQIVLPADYASVFGVANPGYTRQRAGFNRKENKYVANLVNNSTASTAEVNYGSQMTGIKGYFATVKVSTDDATDPGGLKELFAVSSNYVESSY